MKLLALFIALLVMGFLWRSTSKRWRCWVITPIIGSLAICLIAISPVGVTLANKTILGLLPTDLGETVDVIVILGRGPDLREQRVEVARQLWQAKRSPRIFTSGKRDASEMVNLLETAGIPSQTLSGEMCSLTTYENAQYTASILQPRGVRKILLVTDLPHMLRSVFSFRSVGFTVIPHISPLPTALSSKSQALSLLRESLGLVAYTVLGGFRPHSLSETQPSSALLEKLSTWDCKVEG